MNNHDKTGHVPASHHNSFFTGIIRFFIDSKLTPLIVISSLFLGAFAIYFTPKEEEPQIIVPMIDVMVRMPGASPKEIEQRVISPMERLLWEIPGVEYIYSTAMPGRAITIVRFFVGQDTEESLIKTYDKLYSHFDWMPPGCSRPLLKKHSINDVPILALTLWGDGYDGSQLREIAAGLRNEIKQIQGISGTYIYGGLRRQIRVNLRENALNSLGLDAEDVVNALSSQNQASWISDISRNNMAFSLRLDNFFSARHDVASAVVKVVKGHIIRLGQIAEIKDCPEEPASYVMIGAGRGHKEKNGVSFCPGELKSAVTIAFAKRKGWNATVLANKIIRKVDILKGFVIPKDVHCVVTRDYGETAREKSRELLEHLFIATVSVAILMALLLGLRSSLVVLIAIPTTLAVTLFIYYLHGYTLNRVTLFALIFCIGILVDDPIVDVENIVRHLRFPANKDRPVKDVITEAVVEVRSPLTLATFTVIFAILPLAFVRGLMGPYMRPMPVGASVAMFLSMIISFMITPWSAYHILGGANEHEEDKDSWLDRVYRLVMRHLIENVWQRWIFLFFIAILFAVSCSLIYFKVVRVKMLPFDNKSEFQVIIDMPEGTSLEQTAKVAQALGDVLSRQREVVDYELYVGTSAPFNFNGLVRHYYMRRGPNVADIQVNLLPKSLRTEQSHSIAKRLRPVLQEIAARFGADIKVAEIPPGPPVLQTLVAEVYGPDYEKQIQVAKEIKNIFRHTEGIVDVDWYMTDPQPEYRVIVERDKAAQVGVSPERVLKVLQASMAGIRVGLLHVMDYQEDVPVVVRLPQYNRTGEPDLKAVRIRSENGNMVSLAEIAHIDRAIVDHPIYHKNLKPVVYVTGDVSGKEESPVYAILKVNKALHDLETPAGKKGINICYTGQPFSSSEWAVKWDGEWQVTYEVFRDMGIAFAVVMILIFILVVGWFGSYSVPLVILAPIPLSLIGIIPAHAMMNTFFTATSMIGFIAGAGIVVRNSIILADFVELRIAEGMPIEEAVIDAGTVRFRPMLLTSSAVVVGSFVILFDPIFQGLAISLMAGEVAATIFSRMVVPVLYYLDHKIKKEGRIVF